MVVAVALSVVAARAHREWDVACCTAQEFCRWYEQAQRAWRLQEAAPSRKLFCLDAEIEWCAEQRAAGRCPVGPRRLF